MEADLRKKIDSGKISKKAVKDFLKMYYEGDPDCAGCPTGCKEPNECYIQIHLALIDDEGTIQQNEVPYVRDGEPYCCGKPQSRLNKRGFCTICGQEYV